jgi:hemoglobin-like flavoprotein
MKPQPDIHDLYAEAIAAETPEELDRVIPKLRQALHEHCEDVRGKLAHYPLIARRLVRQINDLLLDQETMPRGTQAQGLNSKKK